ncbi:GPCR, rhodopsin-like, 7TM domain and 7TM GPCR, serpentine receptor class x (Srx) family-containing protein [Strongyloides ratti]|uniref:GPCR, rhodopsin-like, 7TM domain and 7TM GPCR, serpentine receptor class x (Srx) family-containing protein n=1 Tax=Strongyloides ratti TaxID=34506 RepID=A0A090LK14_STRRB|nr:GPCR, rhodopsin-like, 7TM domain and 7TM GPCR, serpentine receptor class x (Srx) family-containing protein [Strongyloides ratti]CEF70132.1 GPCR, rhodopsin-like, 7TM domain and 7TM GPCR, serpentine receptor class x (Srx) family-containing protein [Strongyloides ratti]
MKLELFLLFTSIYIINGEIYFNENLSLSDYYNKIPRENVINPDANLYFRMPTSVISSPIPFNGFSNFYQSGRELKIEPYKNFPGGTLSRLILSFNRYIAIHIPFKYKEMFSNKHTSILLIINWIIGLAMIAPLSFGDSCSFVYVDRIWNYETTKFCSIVAYIQDFLYGVIIGSGIIFIDIITAIMLLKRKFKKSESISIWRTQKSQKSSKIKTDIDIFLRTVISNIILILMLISFHFFSHLVLDNINLLFVTTSLFWMSHHFMDGVIVGLLNNDVKKHILSKLKKKPIKSNTVETTRINRMSKH